MFDTECGFEILYCPCGYAVEKCRFTESFINCPTCGRQGRQARLVDRFVTKNKVLAPLRERANED